MSLIELRDIHFAYPGHAPVLQGANLDLAAGERIAITGPNGAGKSTLLRLIVGLQHPDRGTVRVAGNLCRQESDFHDVRRRVGMVFQDADDQLFCPTVAEDIAFGPLNLGKTREEALEIVETVLRQIDMGHLRDRVTHKLSGGEKRLISLASVLAMDPEVLLLDEPTNALDTRNEARLIEILQDLPQAIVLVSHSDSFRHQITARAYDLVDGVLKPRAQSGGT